MSKIFNKLKYFPAQCHFCGEQGNTIGAILENDNEIAICEKCSKSIITGVSVALEHQKAMDDEAKKKKSEENEDKVEGQKPTSAPSAVDPEPLNKGETIDVALDK